jgi:hypothetical protein
MQGEEEETMRPLVIPLVFLGLPALAIPSLAVQPTETPADKVKVQIESVGLHPGMQPGMYVCAAGHLHIKGSVENLTQAPLGRIKVGGRAFDADGNLLGTATASTKKSSLSPGERAEINIEFLTVTGGMLDKVSRHEVTVLEAPARSR